MPVKEGSRVRGVGEVISAEEVKGAVQVVVRITVEALILVLVDRAIFKFCDFYRLTERH